MQSYNKTILFHSNQKHGNIAKPIDIAVSIPYIYYEYKQKNASILHSRFIEITKTFDKNNGSFGLIFNRGNLSIARYRSN